MHGIVFGELKQYVGARLGADAWRDRMDHVDRKVVTTITGPLLHRYGYL